MHKVGTEELTNIFKGVYTYSQKTSKKLTYVYTGHILRLLYLTQVVNVLLGCRLVT